MFSKIAQQGARSVAGRALFSSSRVHHGANVAVLGAAGGIGQPLSLLMKLNPQVTRLNLFDVANTAGVAADLSHINTPAQVTGFKGHEELSKALDGMQFIVIPAGVPRKPGMTRDDLFSINAGIVRDLAAAAAKAAPKAWILIITNPVNSTVPIAAETLKKAGVYDPRKLFGVTTLDVTRANTFVAESQGWDVNTTNVTVIGGHAGTTIMPLLSQVKGATFTEEQIKALTHRIQFAGDEVVQAKDGAGSATLAMALAGANFTTHAIRAAAGDKNVACCFTENSVTKLPFFATPTLLGPEGVEEVYSFGTLSAFEQQNFDAMLPDLEKQIQKGIAFANQ
eukprot:NODE_2108_length_1294_cov_98.974297_g1919_i0.p1 GENE.NODE_2108_length_1294_cov_98.974297_g1919_i0~~NODE_2108_length_1294_cov_98.974297_g1919_i0.p1  ORF type:complete len:338 (-),score=84.95 NODE_2108_length_1294_cov_98.974297_g1919_i0:202-1215(-)